MQFTEQDTISSINLGDYAIFAGGGHLNIGTNDMYYENGHWYTDYSKKYSPVKKAWCINKDLTIKILNDISVSRCGLGAAKVGNLALFAGGTTYFDTTYKALVNDRVYNYSNIDVFTLT